MKFNIVLFVISLAIFNLSATDIPLPEHPRPDFMRSEWFNLNGNWRFVFDEKNRGVKEDWANLPDNHFDKTIVVPFSWAAPLSGIAETKQLVGWYRRNLDVPTTKTWKNKRIMLIIGACDYGAQVWVNGKDAGWKEGGYIPLEFDITDMLTGKDDKLTVRVDELVKNQSVRIRLKVEKATDTEGGLSVFGKQSGRYPLDPSLTIIY